MNVDNSTTIEIVEAQSVGDRVVVVGQLLDGDVRQGMLLESNTGARFEIAGIGFTPVESHKIGKRAMTLINIGSSNDVEVGDRLQQIAE